ncbi:Aquaporin AqpM [Candidatus Gugararchaeum adminiculabundum]|nr:Aquaporin AqpM [Candidatus Gugararchaeum adminiculabundum]
MVFVDNSNNLNKYAAELIGTLALVLMGCGSAVIAGNQIGFLGISFAFGLTVLVMVYAIGSISGCHINPAITISMLVAGKINAKDAAGYILSQIIGGIIGAGILLAIMNGMPGYSLAVNGLGQNGYGVGYLGQFSATSAFIAETVFTMLFLLVIFGATSKRAPQGFAGIAIGFTLVLIHLVSIPITGTSVNPARSIGPAVFVGGKALEALPLFLVAPVLGGILAALLWKYVLTIEK